MDYNQLFNKYAYEFCNLWNKHILNKREKGLLLELFISLMNNNCYLYKDVPYNILNNYGLPKQDKGIDNIQLNENSEIITVCQCKNYGDINKKQRLDHHKLGTFYQQIMTLNNHDNKNISMKLINNNGNSIENNAEFGILVNTNYLYNLIEANSIKKCLTISEHTICENVQYPINQMIIYDKQYNDLYNQLMSKYNFNFNLNSFKSLRPYQIECIDKLKEFMINPNKKVFEGILPCGTGKTIIFSEFILNNLTQNYEIIIVVPLISIAVNIKDKYFKNNANYIWTNTKINNNKRITIYVYDSFKENIDSLNLNSNSKNILLIDEAHHVYKPSYYSKKDIYEECKFVEKIESMFDKVILFSATLDKPNESDLNKIDYYKYNIVDAIENHYITDFRIDINFVPFNNENLKWYYICKNIDCYKSRLIFCNKIKHAIEYKRILDLFYSNLYLDVNKIPKIDIIDSETPINERNKIIKEFEEDESGKNIIISINTLNEGVDIPCARSCIFIDDRSSPINIIQCMGRVMRNYPGKLYGEIVLFANCEKSAEKKYYRYINAINKAYSIDEEKLKERIRIFYDFEGSDKYKQDINEYRDLIFKQIRKYRFTIDEEVQLCLDFWNKYHRKPKRGETITLENSDKIYDIHDRIINAIKHRKDGNKLYDRLYELQCPIIKTLPKFTGNCLAACRAFYEQYHRYPKTNDTAFEFEGQTFNIYKYFRKQLKIPEGRKNMEEIFHIKYEDIDNEKNINNLIRQNNWFKYCAIYKLFEPTRKPVKGDRLYIIDIEKDKNIISEEDIISNINNYVLYYRNDLKYNKENNTYMVQTEKGSGPLAPKLNQILSGSNMIGIGNFVEGLKGTKNQSIKNDVEEILGAIEKAPSNDKIYKLKLHDFINLYNYLENNHLESNWSGIIFNLKNLNENEIKSEIKLNYSISQINTFVSHIRNSTKEKYDKFIQDLRDNNCNANVIIAESEITSLKNQIISLANYWFKFHKLPNQQIKNGTLSEDMKNLKARDYDFDTDIKEFKNENMLNKYLDKIDKFKWSDLLKYLETNRIPIEE